MNKDLIELRNAAAKKWATRYSNKLTDRDRWQRDFGTFVAGFDMMEQIAAETLQVAVEALLTVECCENCNGCKEKAVEAMRTIRGSK